MATETDSTTPQIPGATTLASNSRVAVWKEGDPQMRQASLADLAAELGDLELGLDSITQTVLFSEFTDGGSTLGTLTMTDYIPAGAMLISPARVTVAAGFIGDTSAVLTISDGSDVDRFNTGTPSVFTTAATGIEMGAPSGSKFIVTAVQPILRVTSAADFTSVSAGTMTVTIPFLRTVAG